MSASLLTCAGISVGVSISTHWRMPSRMFVASKGLAVVDVMSRFIAFWSMIRKSGYRFSEKIMLKQRDQRSLAMSCARDLGHVNRLRRNWQSNLEHDPEKWAPVFGKDHAPIDSSLVLLGDLACRDLLDQLDDAAPEF